MFDALEILIPSTVSEALLPDAACAKPKPDGSDEPIVKFDAAPELFATSASREPVASVITLAVMPSLSLLISVATSESVWVPSVVIVVEEPPVVIVKLPAGNAVEPLAKVPDVQEAVVARLFTTTTWFPTELPDAADAVTTFAFEELTVMAESGPAILFRFSISLSRFVASVWI